MQKLHNLRSESRPRQGRDGDKVSGEQHIYGTDVAGGSDSAAIATD